MTEVKFDVSKFFESRTSEQILEFANWLKDYPLTDTWLTQIEGGKLVGITFLNEEDAIAFKLKFEL